MTALTTSRFEAAKVAWAERRARYADKLRPGRTISGIPVKTVYTQDDVTNFAKVITGWTLRPLRDDPAHGGEFTFNPRTHQPGAQVVIPFALDRQVAHEAAAEGRAHRMAAHAEHVPEIDGAGGPGRFGELQARQPLGHLG